MGKHNENKLSVIWDKRQKDFVVKYPRKCDGALAIHHLVGNMLMWDMTKALKREFMCHRTENFKEELEKRGYDLSTLKFSIKLKERLETENK